MVSPFAVTCSVAVGVAVPTPTLPDTSETADFDNTPRRGRRGWVLHGSTPELFSTHLSAAMARVSDLPPQRRLVFVRSWNEWAEGNYLEPDARFGRGFLEAVRDAGAYSDRDSLSR